MVYESISALPIYQGRIRVSARLGSFSKGTERLWLPVILSQQVTESSGMEIENRQRYEDCIADKAR